MGNDNGKRGPDHGEPNEDPHAVPPGKEPFKMPKPEREAVTVSLPIDLKALAVAVGIKPGALIRGVYLQHGLTYKLLDRLSREDVQLIAACCGCKITFI